MDLIDIGANLTHDSFDDDRAEVLERALEAGVTQMIVTGSSVAGSRAALALAQAHPGRLFATAGIHPHHATELEADSLPALAALAGASETVAIGECGLDFFRDFSPRDVQEKAFSAQLGLAADLAMPVFLHQRDAHDRFSAILAEHRAGLGNAVAHCFTGNADELEHYLDLGLHIGITGWICDERRGNHLRDLVARIPLERLMIETDAPYLLPRDLAPKPRTRRNEPFRLPHILGVVAAAMGRDELAVAAATTANARRFFALPPAPQYQSGQFADDAGSTAAGHT